MEILDIRLGDITPEVDVAVESQMGSHALSVPVDVIQEANAVRYTPQNLTDEQKAIARANIGAMTEESLQVEEWEFEMEDGSTVTKRIVLWKEE